MKVKVWLFALLAFIVPVSHAGMINFSFDSTGTHDISGILSFNDALNVLGGHDITGITGYVSGVNGGVITGLVANPNQPFPGISAGYIFDNVLFDTAQHFDIFGVLFSFNGFIGNLWGNSPTDYEFHSYGAKFDEHGVVRVPEPGTLALLGLGLIAVGLTVRKKQMHLHGAIA